MTDLSKNPNTPLAAAIKAAVNENKLIDEAIEDGAELSDIDHINGSQVTKFPLLNGSAFRNPGVAQKTGASLCTDYHIKDRHFTDMVEASNHALRVDNHRKMLL